MKTDLKLAKDLVTGEYIIDRFGDIWTVIEDTVNVKQVDPPSVLVKTKQVYLVGDDVRVAAGVLLPSFGDAEMITVLTKVQVADIIKSRGI